MQALRQIVNVKNNSLNIVLPSDFKADKVEVIILPLEEKAEKKGVANLRGKLNLSDTQYKDFQEDVKNSREGWEKNI
ncbi:MAG: hypothetical protein R6W78_03435 [Bacteroidales bacterium]